VRSFIICIHPKNYWAAQIKENRVGWKCGKHGRGEESVEGSGGKAQRKETTWKTTWKTKS
jgi:hypothetical protein